MTTKTHRELIAEVARVYRWKLTATGAPSAHWHEQYSQGDQRDRRVLIAYDINDRVKAAALFKDSRGWGDHVAPRHKLDQVLDFMEGPKTSPLADIIRGGEA